jgi:glycerol-3-phosphate dehydrogenase (NAD(P)+)
MSISHSPAASAKQALIAVVGAGAWGTALAWLLANNYHPVRLWTRRAAHAQTLQETRENAAYLPGLRLPERISVTSDLTEALAGCAACVVAIPSKGLREVLTALPDAPLYISVSKGIEVGTFERLSSIIAAHKPGVPIAVLSGPNLAREIAAGKPAATTVASGDAEVAQTVQRYFNQPTFRVYTSSDVVGVEIGGAMKNIIALAAGMSDGLALGDNAKAGIITRGLAEIVRLGTHMGGQPRTFYGLAGLGDMIATCASRSSRNHTAGERLAHGATLQALEASQLTAEGIPTVKAVHDYAQQHGLELPITSEVYRVIYQGKAPQLALRDLMLRQLKAE